MPVEIRELIIKATVGQSSSAGAQNSTSVQTGNASNGNEQLINSCVEKVLEILKSKNQR